MEVISSSQNARIKRLVALRDKARDRREEGVFLVEGRRELRHCLNAGFKPGALFLCEEILGSAEVASLSALAASASAECRFFGLTRQTYAKAACREGTEGVIAEIEAPSRTLADLSLPSGHAPLIVVLESVEKPGNLGAVLRSADAAGADAVIFCDPLTDLWNPNLIRSSLGAAFTVPTAACTSEDAVKWLKDRNIRILTAQLQDSVPYYGADMTGGTAIVMGTEATGLRDIWRQAADAHILIPMLGALDSLNVSVSAAILLFEAVRQRQAIHPNP